MKEKKVVLEINNLVTKFNALTALNNCSLKVYENEVVSIIGPSGSGKSTLLRTIFKLEKAENGSIVIDGDNILKDGVYVKNVNKIFSKLGMIFQDFNLFDNLNVYDNIGLALKIVEKKDKEYIDKKIKELLRTLKIEEKIKSYPATLSGGERQRVAIARALAMNPKILLLDEPTSSLDKETIGSLIDAISILKENQMTLLIVTHDLEFASKISDRIVFMEKGQIIIDEKTNLLYNIDNERLENFIKK